MKKTLIIIGIVLVILGVTGYFLFGKILAKPARAALQITSTPDSQVFLDDKEAGKTPFFNDQLSVGEYTVKLVPQDSSSLLPWEGKVTLSANVVTSISYQLASSENLVSGEILSLEKLSDPQKSTLVVVTQPDEALIRINGESKGFAPISVEDLAAGDHQISVSAPGFLEKAISAQTVTGYQLKVSIKLAQEELAGVAEATVSGQEEEKETEPTKKPEGKETPSKGLTPSPTKGPTPTAITLEKPYIKILTTPTGWLRVRLGPSTSATEAAKVNPGEAFPYLDKEENGWYKIEYEKDKEGWVSKVYAELVK